MKIKLLSMVLVLIVFSACMPCNDITPSNHPSFEESNAFLSGITQVQAYNIEEYRHSDIAMNFLNIPEDTIETKYIDDYYKIFLGWNYYEWNSEVILSTLEIGNLYPRLQYEELVYRSKCYEEGEFSYSENDKGYIPILMDCYTEYKNEKNVFYFNNKIETDAELNKNAKPYFITPWCEKAHNDYMEGRKNMIYDTYETDSALPASFYQIDGVCAYQYGVAILYDDYCVRAIAYKDSDEARAVVDEFCDFYGVPTPAEYYQE